MLSSPSPRRTQNLETEIRDLQEQILRWRLRADWATRRMVAMESQNKTDKSLLFCKSTRLFHGAGPSYKDLHDDVNERIDSAAVEGRRINDAVSEVTALKDAQWRSHRDKSDGLRKRRDQVRDKLVVTRSQLLVAEGAMKDDEMLSDAQYRRYAQRIESDRQENVKRYEGGRRQIGERCDTRCTFLSRESDEMVTTLQSLVREKELELERITEAERAVLETAQSLGSRLEEIQGSDEAMAKLRNRLDYLRIEERDARNEIAATNEEIRRSHIHISELDGKLMTCPDYDRKEAAQEAVLNGLMLSVRTLQQRLANMARARRLLPASAGAAAVMAERKLAELRELENVTAIDLREKQQELARVSDNYNHVDTRLREVQLENELLEARLAGIRAERKHNEPEFSQSRGLTATGAAALFAMR